MAVPEKVQRADGVELEGQGDFKYMVIGNYYGSAIFAIENDVMMRVDGDNDGGG